MKKFLVMLMVLTMLFSAFVFAEKEDKETGYNEFGYNYNARTFNGTMYQFYEARNGILFESDINISLVMKWSKDFVIQGVNPEGAWITNHYTWYSDDSNDTSDFGYSFNLPKEDADYRIEEFIKMKAIDNENIGDYSPGYLTLIWGNFVIMMDKVEVYDNSTGLLIKTFHYSDKNYSGFGNLKF